VTGQRILLVMKADKGQFDEVLRRMLSKKPKKTVEIKSVRGNPHPERRRNPLPPDQQVHEEKPDKKAQE
jgi:hypothetical protein